MVGIVMDDVIIPFRYHIDQQLSYRQKVIWFLT